MRFSKRVWTLGATGLLSIGVLTSTPACREKGKSSSNASSAADEFAKDNETGNAILESEIFKTAMNVSLDALKNSDTVKAGLGGAAGAEVQSELDNIVAQSEKLSAAQLVGIIESFLKDGSVNALNVAGKLKGIGAILEALSKNESSAGFIGSVANATAEGAAAIEAAVKAYAENRSAETATAVLQAIWDQVKSAPDSVREKYPINALLAFLASSEGTSGADSANSTTAVLATTPGASVGDDPMTEEQKSGVEAIGQLVDALSAIKSALAAKGMDESLSVDILTEMAKAANNAGEGYAQQAVAMVQRMAVSLIQSGADLATITSTLGTAGEVLALRAKIAALSRSGADAATETQIEQYLAQLNQLVSRMDTSAEAQDAKAALTTLAETVAASTGSATADALSAAKSDLTTKIDESFAASGALPSLGGEEFEIDPSFGNNGLMNLVAPKDVVPSDAPEKQSFPMIFDAKNAYPRTADGKYLLVWMFRYRPSSTSTNGLSHGYIVVQRYDANWNIDSSFGDNGHVVIQSPNKDQAIGSSSYLNFFPAYYALQPDGNLLMLINENASTSGAATSRLMLAKVKPNGTLDGELVDKTSDLTPTDRPTFYGQQITKWNFNSISQSNRGGFFARFFSSISAASDYSRPIEFTRVIKWKNDFTVDTSWGNSGYLDFEGQSWGGPRTSIEDSFGRLYLGLSRTGGYQTNANHSLDGHVRRLTPTGAVDTTFGNNGLITITKGNITSMTSLSADSFVVSMNNWQNVNLSNQSDLSSYHSKFLYFKGNGSVDTNANGGGEEIVNPTVAGRLVSFYTFFKGLSGVNYLSGWEWKPVQNATASDNQMLIARMLPTGRDLKFGTSGLATVKLPGQPESVRVHPFSFFTRNNRLHGLTFDSQASNGGGLVSPAIIRFK